MIFGLAFPVPSDLKLISKGQWRENEGEKRKADLTGYVETPFPSHKVDEFMVSKQFFVLSTAAFFGGATWSDRCSTRRGEPEIGAGALFLEQKGCS